MISVVIQCHFFFSRNNEFSFHFLILIVTSSNGGSRIFRVHRDLMVLYLVSMTFLKVKGLSPRPNSQTHYISSAKQKAKQTQSTTKKWFSALVRQDIAFCHGRGNRKPTGGYILPPLSRDVAPGRCQTILINTSEFRQATVSRPLIFVCFYLSFIFFSSQKKNSRNMCRQFVKSELSF